MTISSKAKPLHKTKKSRISKDRGTQPKKQANRTVSTASTTKKKKDSSRLYSALNALFGIVSFLEKIILLIPLPYFVPPVQFILRTVRSYFPKAKTTGLLFMTTIVLFLMFALMDWNFFVHSHIGLRFAIRILKPNLQHQVTYERKVEVNFLVSELDRLRNEYPKKEVHAIISGGPGAGKSELARQLGQKIYERDNCKLSFDMSWLFPPADVITLDAVNEQRLQFTLEDALQKVQGKDIPHESVVNMERIFSIFHQLRVAFQKRSSLSSHPLVIFDNVKAPMFRYLYKRQDNGKFFLHSGNDDYGEIRVVVTTQHRPTSNFRMISYLNLFEPMPVDEAVKLLNKVSGITNDDKNASYLAKELSGLPKSLADAAVYIQSDRRGYKSSYYFYLKKLKLNKKKYENDIEDAWTETVDEGEVYDMTAHTATLMLIQQLILHSNDHFYQDLACFVGYCGSPVISMKFFEKYVGFNEALKDYTTFKIKTLVRKTSIYEVNTDYSEHNLIFTHQVTRYTSLIACNERVSGHERVESSIARIFHVLQSELTTSHEPSLNQIVEYTSLDFKVIDVIMSLVSKMYKQKLNLSNVITKEFCWAFLDSMAEAYLYWPNSHKSAVIMPDVEFLVNMSQQSFVEQNPDIALLLSLLYLHNTGRRSPENLGRLINMIENFTRSSLSNVDKISIEKTALLVNIMGTVYRDIAQNMSKAQEFHELALDISQTYNSTNEIAISLHLLGIIHRYQKNLDTAREYHEEAVQLGRKIFLPKNSGRLAAFLLNFAIVWNRLGKLKQARDMYEEALELTKKEFGPRDQRVARVLTTLSTNYYSLGMYNKSVQVLLEALGVHEEIHGDFHPNVAQTLYFLGFTYRAKREFQNSVQVLSRSLQIWQQYYGDEHYHVAEVLHDLSNTQRELNLLSEALQNALESVKIFESTLKGNSADLGAALNGLGHVYLALRDPNEAKMKFHSALEIFERLKKRGFQGVAISETLKNIAMALKDLNEMDEAKQHISRALSNIVDVYPETHPRIIELRKFSEELAQSNEENVMESQKEF